MAETSAWKSERVLANKRLGNAAYVTKLWKL